jgi:GNAT superfamily N-acetyltransferase
MPTAKKQPARRTPAPQTATKRAIASAPSGDVDRLVFREVDRSRWTDLAQLFESRGGPKACWCMVWRATPAEQKKTDGASRRAALKRRVDIGTRIGLLGYLDDEPVAWCSIAPRATYRRLGGHDYPGHDPANIWSVVCFFVKRGLRRQGVTARILTAAVAHARAQGATAIEAYPVEPDSPSFRFMGFIGSFKAAGFREVGRAGTRRHVMVLELVKP